MHIANVQRLMGLSDGAYLHMEIYINNIAAMLCFVEEPNDRGLFFSEREKKTIYQSINLKIIFMISGGPYLFYLAASGNVSLYSR
ncbi:hypothetical protein BDA96_01G510600 [Sorghum bicolor]|jgi:hypothetical protein|uniref:Uncharacterized protein n=2 Tax=Sorghum bicolor TaxID=4558 RepID=A0A921S5N7_SORBI|nr:hypothetical protein BDA96_01G510600 [Sorghum bicolor]KXG40023.1 hypothetical protein SORBI_3001G479000 [Sorghum bicolor]